MPITHDIAKVYVGLIVVCVTHVLPVWYRCVTSNLDTQQVTPYKGETRHFSAFRAIGLARPCTAHHHSVAVLLRLRDCEYNVYSAAKLP